MFVLVAAKYQIGDGGVGSARIQAVQACSCTQPSKHKQDDEQGRKGKIRFTFPASLPPFPVLQEEKSLLLLLLHQQQQFSFGTKFGVAFKTTFYLIF